MASSNRVKFKRDYGIITVDAFITGKTALREVTLVFDTGAYMTLIDPGIAAILGYSDDDALGKIRVSSPIGVEHGYRTRVKQFQCCGQAQNDFEVGVIDISNSRGIDGLLGLDFLEKYELNVSFKDQTIELLA